jgi:helicase MOV-10
MSIFYNSHGSSPFIIFGPPGTGKTVTLVETCLQLLLYKPGTTLLLTAPSNAAADLLCSRIAS